MDNNTLRQNVERFRTIMANVKRPGVENLMSFIENKSDYYTAPASTRYHLSCEGGLLQHSLNVYDALCSLRNEGPLKEELARYSNDSIAIVALFHDICKTMFYKVSTRNVKNEETGKWEKIPYYTIEDQIPYGHGEKSVMMLDGLRVQLTNVEKYAIRWHMGGFESEKLHATVGVAFSKYTLALALHIADLVASNTMEDTSGNKTRAPKSSEFENVD